MDVLLFVPIKGLGIPKLLSPQIPLTIGSLNVGTTRTVRVEYTVPTAVKELAISEIGTFRNVKGTYGAYLEIQTIAP